MIRSISVLSYCIYNNFYAFPPFYGFVEVFSALVANIVNCKHLKIFLNEWFNVIVYISIFHLYI